MSMIDHQKCAELVRRIADTIAASGVDMRGDATIADRISYIKAVSSTEERRLPIDLADLYPDIGWTKEEDRPDGDDYWLYDPIDGAYHYLQGLPLWASSLVLVRDGRAVLSIVYDPILRELFIAGDGTGATRNGEPIRIAPKLDLQAAVIGTAIPPLLQVGADEQNEALALLGAVARAVFVVRPMAAASLQLAYVAAGRLDAYLENGHDAADWLAGALLIREAGGIVTDLRGAPFGWSGNGVLTGNPTIHAALLRIAISSG